jgi:cyclophilin family peptidyl-prolyl cis-trans isomerase
MARRTVYSSIEALEARIAPASLAVFHPLMDLMPSAGKTSSIIDLGASLDSSDTAGYRTHVEFLTNFDTDLTKPGLQAGKIVLELFDDKAPLTVQNFLSYVNNLSAKGDFDGTFFHRSSPGFVLQGGGDQLINGQISHIPVSEAVHNEFDANDTERANVVGTVAMAKVGGDPNSATSEWFFNLADNRGNLDNQNGGFTVFAKVVQGMDVVNAIASLATAQIGLTSTGSDGTPVQNGYTGGVPKPNQLVTITDASVIPPKNSTSPNTHWEVVSITDQQGNASDLLGTNTVSHSLGALTGDTLKLNYVPGKSGIATVKVRATSPDPTQADPTHMSVIEESFQVNVQPNLIVHNGGDTLPLVTVNGDSGTGTVKLVNTGAAAAIGKVNVQYYLSHVDGTAAGAVDADGTHLDAGDLLIGSLSDADINIGSGKTGTLTTNLHIPNDATISSGSYRILAKVSASDGSTIVESYTDDNLMLDGRVHGYFTGAAKANLTAIGMSENLPALLIPGDTGVAHIAIGNSASHSAAGEVNVAMYLSYITYDATTNAITDDGLSSNDTLIGLVNQPLVLESGHSMTIDVPISFPKTLTYADGYYRVFGVITSPDGSTNIAELTTSDNVTNGNAHVAQHTFGTISYSNTLIGAVSRTNAPLTYQDSAGNDITLKITGKGSGAISETSLGGIQVDLDGTNANSSFSVVAPTGVIPVFENIVADHNTNAPIGSLNLGNIAWTGSVVAFGGVKNITLGNTTGDTDHFIGVGTSPGAVAAKMQPVIKLGSVQDLSVTSQLTIGSLSATTWTDVNAKTELVRAVGLTNFSVGSGNAGNFEADMWIEAIDPAKTSVTKTFNVAGELKNSTVRISGNVGTVKLGEIESSNFLVGASVVPGSLGDFFANRAVGSFTVTGTANGGDQGIVDSQIAAARFGTISVIRGIAGDSGTGDFGFIADKIAKYMIGNPGTTFVNLDAATEVDQHGNYSVKVLA